MSGLCLNKNSLEFQTLLKRSGLSEFTINAFSIYYLKEFGRFPHLDELPNVNSSNYLKEYINLDENNTTDLDTLNLLFKGNNISETTISINKEFSDLQTRIIPINKKGIVSITPRPKNENPNFKEVTIDKDVNSSMFLNESIGKLASLYGIDFIPITNYELGTAQWRDLIPDAATTKAFIYKNQIYINTDNCSVDSPIHELMHLFLGSVRFTEPDLYFSLTNISESLSNYELEAKKFINRTRGDINEELFVTEFSKHLAGMPSKIDKLPKNILYEINYQMRRVLDSMLFGQTSVSTLSDNKLYSMTLKDIAKYVGSNALNNKYQSLDDAEIHRIMANTKEDLLKKGELKEVCS